MGEQMRVHSTVTHTGGRGALPRRSWRQERHGPKPTRLWVRKAQAPGGGTGRGPG